MSKLMLISFILLTGQYVYTFDEFNKYKLKTNLT